MTDADALRFAVLFVGWPGMVLVSAYVLRSTFRFHTQVQGSAFGRLVVLMVIGWTATMGVLALIATLFLQEDPASSGALTAAFLVFWASSMALIVWLVHRWGAEAVHINLYYTELAAMDRIKTQLINTVAHELNTPLTPILLKFDLLRKGFAGEVTPRQAEVISAIERNLNRLQLLVEQVVLATSIQAGHLPLTTERVPACEWVREVAARFDAQAVQEGRRYDVRCETPDQVQVDRALLERVLASLIENAFRFSKPGMGVAVAARSDGQWLSVQVRDEGRGFTREQHEQLFQPFQYAHDPMQETRAGAGLSLYLAQAIAKAHQGRVDAESPGLDRGSTFTLRIPVASPADAGKAGTVLAKPAAA